MEGESSTQQIVVAASVIAVVTVEAWSGARRAARMARGAAGDAGRACSATGHPGQDHVDQGPQDQAHCHGHTERYDQRNSIKRLKYFQKQISVVLRHDLSRV